MRKVVKFGGSSLASAEQFKKDDEVVPKIKVSNDSIKTINPGYKKVYRFYDQETGYALGDVIALADEIIPDDKYTLVHPTETWKKTNLTNYDKRELLVPIYQNGQLVYQEPTLKEKQDYCEQEYKTLYPEVTRITKPHEYYVDLTDRLRTLKEELIRLHKAPEKDKPKEYVKK